MSLVFPTTWNSAVDGSFDIEIITTDLSEGIFTFPDGSTVAGNVLSSNDPSLDGTLKEVSFTIADFSQIEEVLAIGNKLTGTIDLSVLSGTPIVNLGDVENAFSTENNITEIVHPSNGYSDLKVRRYKGTTLSVDIDGVLWIDGSPNLLHVTATNECTDFSFILCPVLTDADLSGCTFVTGANGRISCGTTTPNLSSITLNNGVVNTLALIDVSNTQLTSIDFSNFVLNGSIRMFANNSLTSLVTPSGTWVGSCVLRDSVNYDLSSATINTSSFLGGSSSATSIIFGAGSPSGIFMFSIAQYTSVNLGTLNPDNTIEIDFKNNGVTFPINNFLIQLDNLSVSSTGTINANGTNPAPTGAGLLAVTSLLGKGWTVNTN